MKKKLLAILLSVCFCLSFMSGCGKTKVMEKVAEDGTPLGKYETPLNIKMAKYTYAADSAALSKLTGITGETLDDNRWTREYSDKLNINVEYSLTGSGDTFFQQWAGMLASGQMPEVASVGMADYKDLVEQDLIWDLTDLYSQYQSPALKTVLAEAGQEVMDAIKVNGRVYGVPQPISQYDSYKFLWIRRDWMEKVGVTKAPETINELIDLMGKFVNNKPGGKEKTYAFTVAGKEFWLNLEGLFGCSGAYPEGWILNDSGKMQLGAIDEKMKEPFSVVSKMFADGWIDPEFATKDSVKAAAEIANGNAGIYMGPHFSATSVLLPSKNNDPNADWAVFPWPGKTKEDKVTQQLSLERNNVLVVSKNCSNPEIAFKMSNLYFENLYGENGNYDYWGNDQVDGIWAIGPLYSYRPNINIIPYREVRDALEGKINPNSLTGASKNYYKKIVTDKAYDWKIMFGDNSSSTVSGGQSAGYYLDLMEKKEISTFIDKYISSPTQTMATNGAELGTQAEIYFNAAIKGTKNTTTDFDAWVKSWKNGGGAKITDEVQKWFDANK